jgi:hypothetical protein
VDALRAAGSQGRCVRLWPSAFVRTQRRIAATDVDEDLHDPCRVDQEQGILGLDVGVFTSRISAIALRPTDRRKL